jgi:hypothetical protein
MENQSYNVGDRVEKFCAACSEQLGHVVKSVTKQGRVSRVSCSECGLTGTFKASAKIVDVKDLPTKTGAPYDRTRTYRQGQIMMHPTFGVGAVTAVLATDTIDVLFQDRVRRLIHSRA